MILSKKLLDDVIQIALRAGNEIMEIYQRDFEVAYKSDDSPLTEADTHSNAVICNGLEQLDVKFPILSEETKMVDYAEREGWDYFWLVDPIDGTKEFIKKNDEFTVNIALIHKGIPVLGVVFAPALNVLYYGMEGAGAYKQQVMNGDLSERKKMPLALDSKPFTVVASKSHLSEETQEFINDLSEDHPDLTTVSKGSSLKLCLVAEGVADIYPRLGPTMEWDTAAAHAVVLGAGKKVLAYSNVKRQTVGDLLYNKENLLNSWFVVQ